MSYQIIAAADEVDKSFHRDELAKFLSINCDPEEEAFEVHDTKIKVLANLKQGTDEEHAKWKKLSTTLKIIAAADEVDNSFHRDELAKFLSINCDPEEEEFEVIALFLIYLSAL
ncbi:hypothetical protein CTI12_AA339290 [Artemisia annua]|uniref:Uncharacterized protein n=1 Tax=Artemisia annua TaxID=35608 RepID=A0A2U1MVS7_ARTAN|nr:hypothetical protein CTI12_AA339290 [Artemisia annua]